MCISVLNLICILILLSVSSTPVIITMYPVIIQFKTLQPKQSVFVLKHKNVEMQLNSQRHTTEILYN